MQVFVTLSEKYFSLNGIQYTKIYQPLKQGSNSLSVVNTRDTRQKLFDSTNYSEIQIDGTVQTSQANAIKNLLDVIYSNESTFSETVHIYPETFGAIGDGVADDTLPIQRAIDTGKTVVLSDKVYSVTEIELTTNIQGNGTLLFNGANNTTCVLVSSSNLRIQLNIDMNFKNGVGFRVDGDNNNIDLHIKNGVASSTSNLSICGVLCLGSHNYFGTVFIKEYGNTGQPNESFPQGFVLSVDSNSNHVNYLNFENVDSSCLVISSAAKTNTVETLEVHNCGDNGLYQLGGTIHIGTMYYDGDDECIVVEGNCYINSLTVFGRTNSIIGLQGAGEVIINKLTNIEDTSKVHGWSGSLMRTRASNTASGRVTLRNVDVTIDGVDGGLMGLNVGTVESLTLENVKMNYKYYSGALTSFVNLESCDQIQFDGVTTNFIDTTDTLTGSSIIQWVLKNDMTRRSFVRGFKFYGFESDGITENFYSFRGVKFAQEKLEANGLAWRGSLQSYVYQSTLADVEDITDVAPTSGYWHRGKILYKLNPSSADNLGWVCVASGTPGTWKSFGTIA